MNVISANSPKWVDAEHSVISLMVLFEEYESLGALPFGAHQTDSEEHGREIFSRAVAGDFGPVAEYVAPTVTPEMIVAQKKLQRQAAVDAIKVTTGAGNVFDGDEISQGRMARAIIGMQTQPGITIDWVLANNVPTPVGAAELTEALALAGLAQSGSLVTAVRMKQVLIAIDQLLNALFGGWADETLSARAYRSRWAGRERLINALFFSETHCQESYISEMQRLQSPPEERMPSA